MAETFYFEIIASDKKFYSGACEHVIFPAVDGLYGVLANHEDTGDPSGRGLPRSG